MVRRDRGSPVTSKAEGFSPMSHGELEPPSFPCAFLGVQLRRLSSSSSFAAMLAIRKVIGRVFGSTVELGAAVIGRRPVAAGRSGEPVRSLGALA